MKLIEKPVEARVITAVKMNDQQLEALESLLRRKLNKDIVCRVEVNTDIIGGLLIYVDGIIIDHSIKRAIGDMKESIMRGIS